MYEFLQKKAIELGKLAIRMTTVAGSGHPSSSLSLAHIVTVLMYHQMRYEPKNPWNTKADRLVLSEGHSVPIVYAAYADLGGVVGKSPDEARELTVGELDTLRAIDSVLDGHPNPAEGFPFFDAATGSLGQGLSVAAGLGLAAKRDRLRRRIYAIIGDGESREGQIWEAIDFIADYKLNNVIPIFNINGQGQSDYTSPQQSAETTVKKLKAAGLRAIAVDGHDVEALVRALKQAASARKPAAIVAKTVKGWGATVLSSSNMHGKPLNEAQMEEALADLDGVANSLPPAGEAVSPPNPAKSRGPTTHRIKSIGDPDFKKLLEGDGFLKKFESNGKISTRRAYGLGLRELGRLNSQVVALDGDVSNSTFSEYFAKAFPERYFEGRIAEQNMISVAGGLAAAGKIPFAHSFGKFLTRAYDQIEMMAITGANIKLVGSHSGASLGPDGPSQMGMVDMAFFRCFAETRGQRDGPAALILFPSDGIAGYKMAEIAAAHKGMVYVRTCRPDVPLIYDPDQTFEPGGAEQVRKGEDLTIVSGGYMLHTALAAAEALEKEDFDVGVLDCYSLPIRSELLKKAATDPSRTVLVVEDNYAGGIGSAIAELSAASNGCRVICMCLNRIPKSGRSPEDVLSYAGVGLEQVIEKARALRPTIIDV